MKYLISILLLLFFASLSAQPALESSWFVLTYDNAVRIDNRPQPLFGESIAKGAIIHIDQHSYLSLFSDKGAVIELDKEGTYNINDLIFPVASVAGFSAQELVKQSRYAFIGLPNATGAVCAGIPMADFLSGGGYFLEEDSVRISWKKMSQDSAFTFFIQDSFGDNVYSQETNKDFITLSWEAKIKIRDKSEGTFMMAGLTSHAYHGTTEMMIQMMEPGSPDIVWRNELTKTYSNKSAGNCLMHAMVLAQRRHSFAAEQYFKKAISLRPDVAAFGKIYKKYKEQFAVDCQ